MAVAGGLEWKDGPVVPDPVPLLVWGNTGKRWDSHSEPHFLDAFLAPCFVRPLKHGKHAMSFQAHVGGSLL